MVGLCIIPNWNLEEETANRDLLTAESRALESESWGKYVNSEWKGIKCLKKHFLKEEAGECQQ